MAIKVLIVDDSAIMRQILSELLRSDTRIEVVGVAADPYVAREQIKALNPDVVTLDLEMPRMDGLSFLERLMALRPMPVVVVSALTQKGDDAAVRALELGAVECIGKPLGNIGGGMQQLRDELVHKVVSAASSGPNSRGARAPGPMRPPADRVSPVVDWIVAIGASTGGVEALQELLAAMPMSAPPILVTQHMPPGFTALLAKRLNSRCAVTIHEAAQNQPVLPGNVYIANGAEHLELARVGTNLVCRLHRGVTVSGHRPSVDVMFSSVAALVGRRSIGVILTGMGRDGAEGLLKMRQAGARTRGQDEASCVVYGMPKAAMMIGAVEAEQSLSSMAVEILRLSAAAG